jgi:hypothetical protein
VILPHVRTRNSLNFLQPKETLIVPNLDILGNSAWLKTSTTIDLKPSRGQVDHEGTKLDCVICRVVADIGWSERRYGAKRRPRP